MDNLTHTLAGGLLARAGLRERTPLGTALCLVAANVPDVDIVAGIDSLAYLNYHRHLTHSLFAIPLMALLAVALTAGAARLLRRPERIRWGPAYGVALLVAYSHPLLDFMNAYGIRLWLPFSSAWSSWDALFVIDPLLWALLAAAWAAGRRYKSRARRLAVLALVLAAGYGVLNRYWHGRVLDALPTESVHGEAVVRRAAFPAPWLPTDWVGVVETETAYFAFDVDTLRLDALDPARARRVSKFARHPAVRAARASAAGRDYGRFAQYGFAQVGALPGGGYRVTLADMRFLRGGRSGLACSFEVNAALDVVRPLFRR